MSDDNNTSIIDDQRTACLCDVGEPDYLLALAVAADGSEHWGGARFFRLGSGARADQPVRGQCDARTNFGKNQPTQQLSDHGID